MKNLATHCLPEMANHGSIKIRVEKEAEASQKASELKNDSSLTFPYREMKVTGQELARHIWRNHHLWATNNLSHKFKAGKCPHYSPATNDPRN